MNELDLADNFNDNGVVDLLIGADFYWSIVSGNVKRNVDTGLVAISSALGWVINGPVLIDGDESKPMLSVNSTHLHALVVQNDKSEDECLSNEARNKCVICKFLIFSFSFY